ncbi:unnamed protein product [Albugo candida]|uniref:FYVE-type domain-containing protein n=1 Tax=Albugo candida TaxID=65357 RepID=A0A024FW44_9STRA|nr:unnamed protein product [Albugo candida]|eukprot:CCI11378.1 unnamed protein product [Albugo candida]
MHRSLSSDSKLDILELRTNELHAESLLGNSTTKCAQKCRNRNDSEKVNVCRRRSSSQSTMSSCKPHLIIEPHKVRSDHRVCFQMVSERSESLHSTKRLEENIPPSQDPDMYISSQSKHKRARKQCPLEKVRLPLWKSIIDYLRKLRCGTIDQDRSCLSLSTATLMTASASALIASDRYIGNEYDCESFVSSLSNSVPCYGIHTPTPMFSGTQVHSGTTTVSSIIPPPCSLWIPKQDTHEPLHRTSTAFWRSFRPRRPRRYCALCLKRFGCFRNRHSFACQLCDRPVCKKDFVATTQVCVCCFEQTHLMEEQHLELVEPPSSAVACQNPVPVKTHRRAKSRDRLMPTNPSKWGRSRGASDQYFKYSLADRDTASESRLSISELVREIDSVPSLPSKFELDDEVSGSISVDEVSLVTNFVRTRPVLDSREMDTGNISFDVAESVSVFDHNRWSLVSLISHPIIMDAIRQETGSDVTPTVDPLDVFFALSLDESEVTSMLPNASSGGEDHCEDSTPFHLSQFQSISCKDLTQEIEGWSMVLEKDAMSQSLLSKFMLRESFSDAWRKCIHAE